MPAPTPQDYRGKKILQQPYDENHKPIPSLFAAITDPGTGLIVGYLPIKATDNGDGTATIKVDTEIALDGSVTVNDVKVGSSNGQVSGDKWLKVLSDGTLIIDKSGLATEAKQDDIIAQLDVTLSTRASEATLGQVDVKLGDIKTLLTSLEAKDFATETTLATRLSESIFTSRTGEVSATPTANTVLARLKDITTQLTTEVRALFDSLGNAITSTLVGIKRGIDVNIINPPSDPVSVTVTNESLNVASLADQGKMYSLATSPTNFTPSGTEHPFLLLRNGAGSGKTVKIRDIIEGIISTNKPTTFRVYANPTVTATGTAATPRNKRIGSPASAITAFTLPTISATGTYLIDSSVVVAGVFTVEEDLTLQFPPGNDLLITVLTTVNNTECTLTVDWAEV